jgi:hypothetical protein
MAIGFGKYREATWTWVFENDLGYVCYMLPRISSEQVSFVQTELGSDRINLVNELNRLKGLGRPDDLDVFSKYTDKEIVGMYYQENDRGFWFQSQGEFAILIRSNTRIRKIEDSLVPGSWWTIRGNMDIGSSIIHMGRITVLESPQMKLQELWGL